MFLHGIAERTSLHPTLTIPSSSKLSPAADDGCRIYYVKPELHLLGECTTTTKMGHNVIVYDIERTIRDILRSRNRIGNQVFAIAMKGYAARKDQNWNKLMEYSEAFRITKLLRQYLEVLV